MYTKEGIKVSKNATHPVKIVDRPKQYQFLSICGTVAFKDQVSIHVKFAQNETHFLDYPSYNCKNKHSFYHCCQSEVFPQNWNGKSNIVRF